MKEWGIRLVVAVIGAGAVLGAQWIATGSSALPVPAATTLGDQSPAFASAGHMDVTINEGLARDTAKALLDWADSKEQNEAALRQALIETVSRHLEDDSRTAEEWADSLISSLPDRRLQQRLRDDDLRMWSAQRLDKAPRMFEIAVEMMRSRIEQLADRSPPVSYVHLSDLPEVYQSTDDETQLGEILFANGCRLLVTFKSGVVRNGYILERRDPSLWIREPGLPCKTADPRRHRLEMSFRAVTMGAGPDVDLHTFMDKPTGALRERFSERLNELVGEIMAR